MSWYILVYAINNFSDLMLCYLSLKFEELLFLLGAIIKFKVFLVYYVSKIYNILNIQRIVKMVMDTV